MDSPPGPFRRSFWRSPIRGPWLTSVFGLVLLASIPVLPTSPGRARSHRTLGTWSPSTPPSRRSPGGVLAFAGAGGGAFSKAALSAGQVMDPESLLALRVNGADLSLDHGYPARVIVPANLACTTPSGSPA